MHRMGVMRRLIPVVCWLATLPCLADPAVPYVPSRDDIVLQTVPSVSDARVRAFEALRADLSRHPRDVTRAVRLSEAYLDYGRDTGDARYLGRALAVIAPWLNEGPRAPPPIPVALVHATILQSRHDFAAARAQLQAVLARDPDNAQAWLTLSGVELVQGEVAAARRACAHLLDASDALLPGGCLAALNAATGRAESASRLLDVLWPQARAEPLAVQGWIQGIQADAAKYLKDIEGADRHFCAALKLLPGDNFLLADYADFLLDQGRAQAALDLVKDYSQSDTSFLRQVYAEAALGSLRASGDANEMRRRLAALEVRGTLAYRREEAGFALKIDHDARRALQLAEENWSVQRAPEDMRVFLEAALAAGQPQRAAPVLELLSSTHLQDPIVVRLAAEVRTRLGSADAGTHAMARALPMNTPSSSSAASPATAAPTLTTAR